MINNQVGSKIPHITRTQFDILNLLALGYQDSFISSSLLLEEDTIKKHIEYISKEFEATSRESIVVCAIKFGFLSILPSTKSIKEIRDAILWKEITKRVIDKLNDPNFFKFETEVKWGPALGWANLPKPSDKTI